MNRILILFYLYRNFIPAVISIDLIGSVLIRISQSISYASLFTLVKILVNLIIGFMFHTFRKDLLYYYHNLGYSTISIYSWIMILDLAIWIIVVLGFVFL